MPPRRHEWYGFCVIASTRATPALLGVATVAIDRADLEEQGMDAINALHVLVCGDAGETKAKFIDTLHAIVTNSQHGHFRDQAIEHLRHYGREQSSKSVV